MSAALFLVPALPAGDLYTLDGPEGHHAADVVRLRVGERALLGDGQGSTVDCTVVATGKGTVTLSVGRATVEPRPSPSLTVVQGIAKADRSELAVQAMTEVGVDTIVPWTAARSVVRWTGERGRRSQQRWVGTAREAAKQARRSWLPVVEETASTGTVASILASAAAGLVLHEDAAARLSTVDLAASGDIVLVIGPEGGIADEELAAFMAAGAVPVLLGRSILRTSTAGVAALAVLSTRLGRW